MHSHTCQKTHICFRRMGFFETIFLLHIATLFYPDIHASDASCSIFKCRDDGPVVGFPFRLQGRQQELCGYQGFDIACNEQNETVLELPSSGKFLVRDIDYSVQIIRIYDPDNCLAKRFLYLNLSGSPFKGVHYGNYTFLSCSSNFRDSHFTTISCLSSSEYQVLAISSVTLAGLAINTTCRSMKSMLIPIMDEYGSTYHDFNDDLSLIWDAPESMPFEAQKRKCRKWNSNGENKCSGLLSDFGFVAAMGISVPALLCMIGMICYVFARLKAKSSSGGDADHHSSGQTNTITAPLQTTTVLVGLDELTIASYPTRLLTEILSHSDSNIDANDKICSICLSDYQPHEPLKSIPDCNHYFHAVCIDEWLRNKAMCPLCRNFHLRQKNIKGNATNFHPQVRW